MAEAVRTRPETITRQELIELFNEDLAREYQAVIAYVIYSQGLKGAQYMAIAEELKKHASEELRHALIISKHVDYLGGMPTATPLPVIQSERPEEMRRSRQREQHHPRLSGAGASMRGARRIRDRRGHPGNPAAGAGAPDRSRHGAGREPARSLATVIVTERS